MNRRDFSAALVTAGLGTLPLALPVSAFAQGEPSEGKQFTKVEPPVPPLAMGKIEVLEFFSYACPHCAAFEPTLEAWAKKLPTDAVLRRLPAPFLMNADNFIRTYYTLEALNLVDAMQRKVFNAVHVDHVRLDKPEAIAEFMGKNGLDAKKFLDTFNSFSVATSATKSKKIASAYKLDSVPTLAVNGHFVTSPSTAGGAEQALAVVDYLIQKTRKGA